MRTTYLPLIALLALNICKAQQPTLEWAREFASPNPVFASDLTLDAAGNSYATGSFSFGPMDLDPGTGTVEALSAGGFDVFVSKLDANGDYVWSIAFGGPGDDNGEAIAVDAAGNVYVTGTFEDTVDMDPGPGVSNLVSVGNADIFISKWDPAGNLMWVRQVGGPLGDKSTAIKVDDNGNVFLIGSFLQTVDFDPGTGIMELSSTGGSEDIFVLVLNAAGELAWVKHMGGILTDLGNDLDLDNLGAVYLTGSFSETVDFDPGAGLFELTSTGNLDMFVCKLDATGNFAWAQQYPDNSGGKAIALDPIGNVYTSGSGTDGIWIRKMDNSGNLIWAKNMANVNDSGYSLAFDDAGNVYTTGDFRQTVDFDPGAGTYELTSAGSWDCFVHKMDSAGNFMWAVQMGNSLIDVGYAIDVDALSNVHVFGYFRLEVDFDPGPGTFLFDTGGSTNSFSLKLGQPSVGLEDQLQESMRLYPNPADREVQVDLGAEYPNVTLILSNTLGQILQTQNLPVAQRFTLEINEGTGIYFLEVRTGNQQRLVRKIIVR